MWVRCTRPVVESRTSAGDRPGPCRGGRRAPAAAPSSFPGPQRTRVALRYFPDNVRPCQAVSNASGTQAFTADWEESQVYVVVKCQNTAGSFAWGWQDGGLRRDDDPPYAQGSVFDYYAGQQIIDYEYTGRKFEAGAQWYGWTFQYAPLGGLHYAVSDVEFDIDTEPEDVVWLNYTKVAISESGRSPPPPPRPKLLEPGNGSRRCTPQRAQVSAGVGKPPHGLGGCIWMPLVNGTGNSPSLGRPTPGVVKQDKSSGGSVDTTKTRSGPQRVRMSSGERPIGAAKGKQSDTLALCQPPAPRVALEGKGP